MDSPRTEVTGESDSTRAIRNDIARTRRDMSHTIDEIQYRFSPEHMKQSVRRTGVNTSRKLIDKVKENPIPAAMVGVGLWMLFRDHDSGGAGFRPQRYRSYDVDSDFDEDDRLEQAKDRMRNAAESAREKASEISDRAGEKVDELKEQTREKVMMARNETRDFINDSPLIAGIAALALGALLGGVIPESDKENELLGDTRDRLLDRTKVLANDAMDRAKNVASAAAETAKNEAKNEVRKMDVPQDLGIGR